MKKEQIKKIFSILVQYLPLVISIISLCFSYSSHRESIISDRELIDIGFRYDKELEKIRQENEINNKRKERKEGVYTIAIKSIYEVYLLIPCPIDSIENASVNEKCIFYLTDINTENINKITNFIKDFSLFPFISTPDIPNEFSEEIRSLLSSLMMVTINYYDLLVSFYLNETFLLEEKMITFENLLKKTLEQSISFVSKYIYELRVIS